MSSIDLIKLLKPYSDGWVAIDEKHNKVVAHEKTFASISEKVKDMKDIILLPASKNYFGFVTSLHA